MVGSIIISVLQVGTEAWRHEVICPKAESEVTEPELQLNRADAQALALPGEIPRHLYIHTTSAVVWKLHSLPDVYLCVMFPFVSRCFPLMLM